ncbi:MAG: glycosyltransferase family 39 protein [Reichenbachiella sp.]
MKLVLELIQSRKLVLFLITLVYASLSIYFYHKYGIKVVTDSPRYLGYAEGLKTGFYFDPLNFWYLSYVVFIYVHQIFSDNVLAIILSQYALGFAAVLSLFRTAELLTKNRTISFLTCILFMFFPDNLFWHSYILSESVYSSFICFSVFALIYHMKLKSRNSLLILIVSICITFFCKPTSPALILAILFPSIYDFLIQPRFRILRISAFLICTVGVMVLANQMLTMHQVMLIYSKGDIIFLMHEFTHQRFQSLLAIDIPANLYTPNHDTLILSMVEFIINNPLYYFKLFSAKLIVYLTHIRPYWSLTHNLWVILTIWPCYLFSFFAIKRKLIAGTFSTIALIYFSIHSLIISNTWVDWDARFFVPLFPILALFGSIGFYHISESILVKKRSE